jgi:GTP:adenosylcobinamide-phosphate guanylyltransferase
MDALILAGGKDTTSLESSHKINNKALLMINNVPMIEYVVNALNQAQEIQNVIVVGPKADLLPHIEKKVSQIIDSTDSFVENVKIGIDNIDNDEKLMILTSDVPLITGKMIDDFIKECQKYDAFLYYPFIKKELILKKFPQTVRSYASLKEGTFCGGNMVILESSLFNKNEELLNEVFQNRKDLKKYIALLGVKFIIKYLFRCLTVQEIEDRAAKIVGYPVKGVMVNYPEMMIDLDKLSDYELILQILNN